MKPILFPADFAAQRVRPLAQLDLAEFLAGLASRMDPDQRHAFLAKMAEMDRQRARRLRDVQA